MKALDLFCGVGGLTHGLARAGWEVVAGIDIDGGLATTYERNNPSARFINADIKKINIEEVDSLLKGCSRKELLLAGCAPCQPFSKQRRGPRSRNGVEGTLMGEFGRLVRLLRPKVILMENVPGIARVPGFSAYRRFLQTLRVCGYSIDQCTLNARDFGVPQHRRRLVLLAVLEGRVMLPATNKILGDVATVREAISHLPEIHAGEAHASIANHCAARLSPLNFERIKATPIDGGSRCDWPEHLWLHCHRGMIGFNDVYGRMWWDRVAPTLTSKCNSLSNGRFGHPEQNRAISLREAAALQSFPDSYEFHGPRSHIARWIGNAVPVLLGEELGRAALMAAT